jgi:glycosyltransferase involved in cell wall biosynthesis
MSLDVVYFARNREAFTRHTLNLLLHNTDWGLVDRLILYDDDSSDGSRDILRHTDAPVPTVYRRVRLHTPVAVMNHYLDHDPATLFAKIDNDIAVPPGWLERTLDVMADHPHLELLGMELLRGDGHHFDGYEPCSHIGGVGVMRSSAFLSRPRMAVRGMFGFTLWQHEQEPVRGFVAPWLKVLQLDRLPLEPWRSLSDGYIRQGWQRDWPVWDESHAGEWAWMVEAGAVA